MLWGLFPATGFAVLRCFVAALGQAQPVMMIVVAGTLFNIVWNYILGFGKFGFPNLGLTGLALASVLTLWGMFLSLAIYVLVHPQLRDYKIFQELYRIRLGRLAQVAWLGLPIGLFSGLEAGFYMVIMFWAGRLGTTVLAAHQIAFQTLVIVFMVPLGISYATTVRVGQWLGQTNRQGIQQATWAGITVTTIVMSTVSLAFLLFPKQIIGIYLDVNNLANTEVIATAIPFLFVTAFVQVLDGLQKTVYGSLQGLQDTHVPMAINILAYGGVGLPVSYALGFTLGGGGVGLWIGQSVAVVVVAGLFSWRLYLLFRRLSLSPNI
jgi:MATE family multidrug resistance protein